jgi:hypothetical protein
MEYGEFDRLGFWEKQVACSKLWGELTTPIYHVRDNKGRTPSQAKVRRTNWAGCWLYSDADGYQVLEDRDVERFSLVMGS